MQSTEQWRTIPGWEGFYEVSDLGRVRSLDRTIEHPVSGPTRRRGKVLRTTTDDSGHLLLDLKRSGERRTVHVHRLVAETFVPGAAPDLEVRHRDGNPAHNAASNLLWGTHGDNTLDSVGHGTHNQARKTHCPQLHPYDATNTYNDPSGRRQCRTCRRDRDRNTVRKRVRSNN
jgi:hypothetical protein